MAVIDEARVTPYWLRKKREYMAKGSPAAVAHLFPQISKWRRAFVKEEYLRGQITQLNLVQMIAEIRDRWVKTATQLFPRLKDVLGE